MTDSLWHLDMYSGVLLAQAEKKEAEAPKEAEQMDTDAAADAAPAGKGAQTGTEAGGPEMVPEVSEPMAD